MIEILKKFEINVSDVRPGQLDHGSGRVPMICMIKDLRSSIINQIKKNPI